MKRREAKVRLEEPEKKGFEARAAGMFGAAVAAPELWLGVMMEERFWVVAQEESVVVTPLVVASSLLVSPSSSCSPPASASAPP